MESPKCSMDSGDKEGADPAPGGEEGVSSRSSPSCEEVKINIPDNLDRHFECEEGGKVPTGKRSDPSRSELEESDVAVLEISKDSIHSEGAEEGEAGDGPCATGNETTAGGETARLLSPERSKKSTPRARFFRTGAWSVDDCPADRRLPISSMVLGGIMASYLILSAVDSLQLFPDSCVRLRGPNFYDWVRILHILLLIACFVTLVYFMVNSEIQLNDRRNSNYCNSFLLLFLWVIIASTLYISLVFFVLLLLKLKQSCKKAAVRIIAKCF